MPMTYFHITGRVTAPDSDLGIRAKIIARPLTQHATLKFEGERVTYGSAIIETDVAGNLPAPGLPIPQTDAGTLWRISVEPIGKYVGLAKSWTVGDFEITADVRYDEMVEQVATAVTATFFTNVQDFAERAETAAEAAEAVGNTNDTIIASRINDPASATSSALSASYVSVTGRPVNAADYRPEDYSGSVGGALNAAIAAARAASGNRVELPPVEYVLDVPLVDDTSGNADGLVLLGASRGTTLTADFDNDAILTLDGSGVNYQFQKGGEVSNVAFRQEAGRVGVRGIETVSSWDVRLKNVLMSGLTSDGLYAPDRTDLDANPDAWASVRWDLEMVVFELLDGYGINAPAGLGWTGGIDKGYFNQCRQGGIYAGGHALSIFQSAFASCGEVGGKGAVWLERMQNNTPNRFSMKLCEVDGNYGTAQVTLQAVSGFDLSYNTFISRVNAGDTAHRAPIVVQFGDAANHLAERGDFRHNFHRGSLGSHPLTWTHYGSVSASSVVDWGSKFQDSPTGMVVRAGSVLPRETTPARVENNGYTFTRYSDAGALPAASATYRGQVRMVQGGAGVADRFVVCRKDAADAYAWADLF